MYAGDKVFRWEMRCAKKDMLKISRLAKILGVKESEAVRRAVDNMLAVNKASTRLRKQKAAVPRLEIT